MCVYIGSLVGILTALAAASLLPVSEVLSTQKEHIGAGNQQVWGAEWSGWQRKDSSVAPQPLASLHSLLSLKSKPNKKLCFDCVTTQTSQAHFLDRWAEGSQCFRFLATLTLGISPSSFQLKLRGVSCLRVPWLVFTVVHAPFLSSLLLWYQFSWLVPL